MSPINASVVATVERRHDGERRSQRGGFGSRLADRSSTTLTTIDVVSEGVQHEPRTISPTRTTRTSSGHHQRPSATSRRLRTIHARHAMANLNTSVTPSRVGKDYVSGSELAVHYPAASGPWADPVQVPQEPSLGYSVNDLLPTGEPHEIAASIAALGPGVHSPPSSLARPDLEDAATRLAEVAVPSSVVTPPADGVERTSAKPKNLKRPMRKL
jgi:hypothetical protein